MDLLNEQAVATETDEKPLEEIIIINPYAYPEFAGLRGERYLHKLLRQILPLALYRTWEIFTEHQAPDQPCYMGLMSLADLAQRAPRTLQKNLDTLCARGLLTQRAERQLIRTKDGRMVSRAVVVKDFQLLYKLAHEYHEWQGDERYVPAKRALVELWQEDEEIVAKVRRFENYRRVLMQQRPELQTREQEENRWFKEYLPENNVRDENEKEGTEDGEKQETYGHTNILRPEKELETGSEWVTKVPGERSNESVEVIDRERYRDKNDSKPSRSQAPQRVWKGMRAGQSGGEGSDGFSPHLSSPEGRGANPQEKRRDDTVSSPSSPQDWETNHRRGEIKNESSFSSSYTKNPVDRQKQQNIQYNQDTQILMEKVCDDIADASQPEHRQTPRARRTLSGGERPRGNWWAASQSRVPPPDVPMARSFVREISSPFGDHNPASSVTRVLRVIAEQDMAATEILCCLVRAYTVARDTHRIRSEHCDPATGRQNRMPLFCVMFERFASACMQSGNDWEYTWQHMVADIEADDRLGLWCYEYSAKCQQQQNGAQPPEPSGQPVAEERTAERVETRQIREPEALEQQVAERTETRQTREPEALEQQVAEEQTTEEMEEGWVYEKHAVLWADYLQWRLCKYGQQVQVGVRWEEGWYGLVMESEGEVFVLWTRRQVFDILTRVQAAEKAEKEASAGDPPGEGEPGASADSVSVQDEQPGRPGDV
ncbi:MAG TPA: hypothetical protein VGF67_00415 [Ktedonobacteraceae bacterium]|jgi:hypothetical protein